jgi:hypothetical protein
MSKEQIINAIANACEDDRLHFQIIIQDSTLHIYINRPIQVELNYQQIKEKIYTTVIDRFSSQFDRVWLYCRILGEVEPDWQSVLEIEANVEIASAFETIATAVKTTNSIVEKIERELHTTESFAEDTYWDIEDLPTTADDHSKASETEAEAELDLSQYCFIRNKRLLYAVLAAPEKNIARLVDKFDWFDVSFKRSQLPLLKVYFEDSVTPKIDNFEPEVRRWWLKIEKLDLENKRKLAIWLSRYCLNPTQTISTIKGALATGNTTSRVPKLENTSSWHAPQATDTSTSQQSSDLVPKSTSTNSSGFWFGFNRVVGKLLKIFKSDKNRM